MTKTGRNSSALDLISPLSCEPGDSGLCPSVELVLASQASKADLTLQNVSAATCPGAPYRMNVLSELVQVLPIG